MSRDLGENDDCRPCGRYETGALTMSCETEVTIAVHLSAEAAAQLAQFCKRSTFDTFYEYTEAHLTADERKRRAYQMISGVGAVQAGLAEAGFGPR
jgi:hypothetical protein